MRDLLCVSRQLRRTCTAQTRFDVWAHHPYTSGGPTRKAFRRDDVSLGNLPEMRAVLDAAVRHRRIVSRRKVEFWVTEFGWDTSPPDPKGIPLALHARWTAEALYRMWANGVSLATWHQLRDDPFVPNSFFQAGLYFRGATMADDRPKPSVTAFRFPFVAFRQRNQVMVWGRTPTSRGGTVVIEHQVNGRWIRTRKLRANRHGVFSARFARPANTGWMRARFGRETARPFSLAHVKDRYFAPFGTGWGE
jgi:hypothetical protein